MSDSVEKNELVIDTKNFLASAESFKVYIPSKEVNKDASAKEGKSKSFPIYVRRIVLNCKNDWSRISNEID